LLVKSPLYRQSPPMKGIMETLLVKSPLYETKSSGKGHHGNLAGQKSVVQDNVLQ